MKYKLLTLLLAPLLLVSVLTIVPVDAASSTDAVCDQLKAQDIGADCGTDTLFGEGGVVHKISETLIFIVGAISVIVLIIAGLMYVLSAGNPEQTKRAKDAILYAAVGLAVAVLAFAIVNFVLARLDTPSEEESAALQMWYNRSNIVTTVINS